MAMGGHRPPRSKDTHHQKAHKEKALFTQLPKAKPRGFAEAEQDVDDVVMANPLNDARALAAEDEIPSLADVDTDAIVESENTRLWV
jgi:hypothetical protein